MAASYLGTVCRVFFRVAFGIFPFQLSDGVADAACQQQEDQKAHLENC